MTPSANSTKVYQLRLRLLDVNPMIWRRVLVRDDSTIADLHYTYQIVMGWSDTYLNQFIIQGKQYGVTHTGGMSFSDNPNTVHLNDLDFYLNERFIYEYNFFDHWQLETRVENYLEYEVKKYYQRCIGGRRLSPPEECGGPIRFMQLAEHYSDWTIAEKLLTLLQQRQGGELEDDGEEVDETLHELRYWSNQHRFNRRAVNRCLQQFAAGDPDWQFTLEEELFT